MSAISLDVAFRLTTDLNIDGTTESSDFAFIATLLDFAKNVLSSGYSKEAVAFKKRLFSSSRYQTYHYQTGEPLDYKLIADIVATLLINATTRHRRRGELTLRLTIQTVSRFI